MNDPRQKGFDLGDRLAIVVLALGLIVSVALVAYGAGVKIAVTASGADLSCPAGTLCEVHLEAGRWRIFAPKGQMVFRSEGGNETEQILDTAPPHTP